MKAIESVKLFILSVLLPALALGGAVYGRLIYIFAFARENIVESVPCFLLEASIYFVIALFIILSAWLPGYWMARAVSVRLECDTNVFWFAAWVLSGLLAGFIILTALNIKELVSGNLDWERQKNLLELQAIVMFPAFAIYGMLSGVIFTVLKRARSSK